MDLFTKYIIACITAQLVFKSEFVLLSYYEWRYFASFTSIFLVVIRFHRITLLEQPLDRNFTTEFIIIKPDFTSLSPCSSARISHLFTIEYKMVHECSRRMVCLLGSGSLFYALPFL